MYLMERLNREKFIARFILLPVLLLSIFVSANHHHKDLQPHYDCPVCLFQINSSSSDVSSADVIIKPIENNPIVPLKREVSVFTQKLKKPNQRAPPSVL